MHGYFMTYPWHWNIILAMHNENVAIDESCLLRFEYSRTLWFNAIHTKRSILHLTFHETLAYFSRNTRVYTLVMSNVGNIAHQWAVYCRLCGDQELQVFWGRFDMILGNKHTLYIYLGLTQFQSFHYIKFLKIETKTFFRTWLSEW